VLCLKGNTVVTIACDTGVDPTTISSYNCKLLLAKIYENSSLDHSLFCTFDPRSNAGLLRERARDDHDHNSSDYCNGAAAYVYPNAHYGGVLRGRPLIGAAPFSGANTNSLPFEIASVLVRFDHIASRIGIALFLIETVLSP
jgi:hypothetical protein